MSKAWEKAECEGMGWDKWSREWGDKSSGRGRRVWQEGQGEEASGSGVEHFGQGRRGAGFEVGWVV